MAITWSEENLNPGVKFPFKDEELNLEDPYCSWIEIVLLTEEETLDIFKKNGVKINKKAREINPKTRRVEYVPLPVDLTDEQRRACNADMWDKSIRDWNLPKPDGTFVPCTREKKIEFMSKSPRFSKWYEECKEKLEGELGEYKEELEKN